MIIRMDDSAAESLEQMRAFLKGSGEVLQPGENGAIFAGVPERN